VQGNGEAAGEVPAWVGIVQQAFQPEQIETTLAISPRLPRLAQSRQRVASGNESCGKATRR